MHKGLPGQCVTALTLFSLAADAIDRVLKGKKDIADLSSWTCSSGHISLRWRPFSAEGEFCPSWKEQCSKEEIRKTDFLQGVESKQSFMQFKKDIIINLRKIK